AANAEQGPSTPSSATPQSVESLPRQGTAPLTGQSVSYVYNSGRFVDGYGPQPRIPDSQEVSAAEFITLPLDITLPKSIASPAGNLAWLADADGNSAPTPLSGDLVLDFLPCNLTALQTAVENLLAESEQVLLNGVHQEALSLGIFIAALVTSGMA